MLSRLRNWLQEDNRNCWFLLAIGVGVMFCFSDLDGKSFEEVKNVLGPVIKGAFKK